MQMCLRVLCELGIGDRPHHFGETNILKSVSLIAKHFKMLWNILD